MKFKMLSIIVFFVFAKTKAQNLDKETASILAEGKMLYRSEMASWNGTDILQARFKNRAAEVSGYFSYPDGEQTKCVFFDKRENPTPLITFTFDASYNTNSVAVDTTDRDFTSTELEYFTIRQRALKAIKTDTLFKTYNNTNLNLIPTITRESKTVFVLTGSNVNGLVVFGNDYLLTFDKSNQLMSIKRLHKNVIPINYTKESVETIHSHLPETGDFITSTDICTLMLYGKIANWKNHIVVSKKYTSIWDCDKQTLHILTTEALREIVKEN